MIALADSRTNWRLTPGNSLAGETCRSQSPPASSMLAVIAVVVAAVVAAAVVAVFLLAVQLGPMRSRTGVLVASLPLPHCRRAPPRLDLLEQGCDLSLLANVSNRNGKSTG